MSVSYREIETKVVSVSTKQDCRTFLYIREITTAEKRPEQRDHKMENLM